MRILHCADIHLGRRRLDGRLPESDFATAFQHIARRAVEWKAKAFLIAGDLFDTPQITPPILRQSAEALAPLRKARIPVIAIEGNHDRTGFARAQHTWMQYLAEEGLLRLLSTPFTVDGPILEPYDKKTGCGAMLELSGVRFIGAGYLGAGTNRKIRAIVEALPKDDIPNVMLLHAGPEYFVGEGGGFRKETLKTLQERIAYLALGHIHKPMMHGGEPGRSWAINPGSPENCTLDEASQKGPRGWAEIEIEPQALPGMKLVQAKIEDCPRRPVLRVDLDVSAWGNKLKAGSEKIKEEAVKAIAKAQPTPETIVRLFLCGDLNIGRIGLEPQKLSLELTEETKTAGVEVNLDDLRLYTGRLGELRPRAGMSNAEIERAALVELLRQKPPQDLEEDIDAVAELYTELRELIASNAAPEAALERLEASPLPARMAEKAKTSFL